MKGFMRALSYFNQGCICPYLAGGDGEAGGDNG